MATETVLSYHPSPDKTVEKVDEETQRVKLENVQPPKEVGGKDEKEKLETEELAGPETPVNELEETTGVQTKPSAAVEAEKIDDTLAVDFHVEADTEKKENCTRMPESSCPSEPGDKIVETQPEAPEDTFVVETVDNASVEVSPEVDLKVDENSVLDPKSSSASKGGETVEGQLEMPEGHPIEVQKVDDVPVVDIATETSSKVIEDSVLQSESSSASEPGGINVEREVDTPKGQPIEVEQIDEASVKDVLAEDGLKMVENSVLEPESASASEPSDVAVERQSEEHPIEVEKGDDATILNVPAEASSTVVENSVPGPESLSTSKPGDETVEIQREAPEEHPVEVDKVEKIPIVEFPHEACVKMIEVDKESSPSEPSGETIQRQPEATKEHLAAEMVGTQQEEQAAAKAKAQAEEKSSIDKPLEHLEEVAKLPEAIAEEECKLVPKMEGEGEKAEVIKEVEGGTEEIKARESLESGVVTSPGTIADNCKGNESLKGEKASMNQEPVEYENSAQVDPNEEDGDSSISDLIEKTSAKATSEEGSEHDVVEKLLKDDTVVTAKVKEEKEEKNVKIECEEKSAQVEEYMQTETAKTEDTSSSNLVAEVAEIDGGRISRDVEVVAETKNVQNLKGDIPVSVDTNKDKDEEGKLSEVSATSTAYGPTVESKEPLLEAKAEEGVKTNTAHNLDGAKEEGEIVKCNPPKLESSKNGDDTKTSGELPKKDGSVKSTQKHSSNLISKVKQSIVKVKKAIIGKSPSSKTLLPEGQRDEKLK